MTVRICILPGVAMLKLPKLLLSVQGSLHVRKTGKAMHHSATDGVESRYGDRGQISTGPVYLGGIPVRFDQNPAGQHCRPAEILEGYPVRTMFLWRASPGSLGRIVKWLHLYYGSD